MRSAPLIHSVLFSLLLVGPGALAAQNLPGGNPRDYGERQRRAAEQYRREMLHDVTATFGRWKSAWADDDAGDTTDYYTDDAVIIIPTQSAAYRGKDDVEQFLEDLLPTLGELSTWRALHGHHRVRRRRQARLSHRAFLQPTLPGDRWLPRHAGHVRVGLPAGRPELEDPVPDSLRAGLRTLTRKRRSSRGRPPTFGSRSRLRHRTGIHRDDRGRSR